MAINFLKLHKILKGTIRTNDHHTAYYSIAGENYDNKTLKIKSFPLKLIAFNNQDFTNAKKDPNTFLSVFFLFNL